MNTRIILSALLLLTLCLSGCTSDSPKTTTPNSEADATPKALTTQAITAPEIHDAICGHVLEDVGHCGNYVKIDGKYVVLEYPSLGVMEYCKAGKKGAKVEITGEMKNGKFVASTYRQVE